MRFINLKLVRIVALLTIVTVLAAQTNILQSIIHPSVAQAVGDLTVDWGIGFGNVGPIFTVNNMAPGQSSSKTVTVKNNSTTLRPVGIRGIKTSEDGNLSDALDVTISRNGSPIYGPISLAQFFTDSNDPSGINLFTQSPGDTSHYTILVKFRDASGNQYQNTNVIFSIQFGISFDLPEACQTIDFTNTTPIFGTARAENLNGTGGNDIILGLEGSDTINGKGGNDCIIGGPGADKIVAGDGNDVVLGGEGSDKLIGDNGNDVMFGENGSDSLVGGNGNDILSGGNNADSLIGNSGNDTLTGDAGSDTAKGGDGTDTCSAESKIQCEL